MSQLSVQHLCNVFGSPLVFHCIAELAPLVKLKKAERIKIDDGNCVTLVSIFEVESFSIERSLSESKSHVLKLFGGNRYTTVNVAAITIPSTMNHVPSGKYYAMFWNHCNHTPIIDDSACLLAIMHESWINQHLKTENAQ